MIIQYSYELAISSTHSKRKNVSLHNSKMINETFTLLCSILINWMIDSFLLVREIYLLGGWTEGFVLQHEYIRHQSSSSFLSIRETGLLLLVCAVCGSGDCLFFSSQTVCYILKNWWEYPQCYVPSCSFHSDWFIVKFIYWEAGLKVFCFVLQHKQQIRRLFCQDLS